MAGSKPAVWRPGTVTIEESVAGSSTGETVSFEVPADQAPPQMMAYRGRLPTEQAFTTYESGHDYLVEPARGGQALPGNDTAEAQGRRFGRQTSYVHNPRQMPVEGDPLLDFVPAPHTAPRRNSITADRQREFIAALAVGGIVLKAALHIGASPEALYNLRNKPGAEGFAAAWDEAVERGFQRLEDAAIERAICGENRLVSSGGKLLGYETRHNEALVMFMLRNRRPERYGGSGRSPKLPPLRTARRVAAEGAGTGVEAALPAAPAPVPALPDPAAEEAELRGWKRRMLEQPGSVDLRRFTGFQLERLEAITPAEAFAPDPVPDGLEGG
ncbi:hypothetical protein V5740_07700 [Croceibacterium sp. TMG7-5b_MA50]|uniref:hypothetical protein n=1 Tax=Croceibacterium sp. TMG7-5b_MA50 TaxID=3121290 RepID=UPI00322206AD